MRSPPNEPKPFGATAMPPSKAGDRAGDDLHVAVAVDRKDRRLWLPSTPMTSRRWSNAPTVSNAIPVRVRHSGQVCERTCFIACRIHAVDAKRPVQAQDEGVVRREVALGGARHARRGTSPGRSRPGSSWYPPGPRANGVTVPLGSTRNSAADPATIKRAVAAWSVDVDHPGDRLPQLPRGAVRVDVGGNQGKVGRQPPGPLTAASRESIAPGEALGAYPYFNMSVEKLVG